MDGAHEDGLIVDNLSFEYLSISDDNMDFSPSHSPEKSTRKKVLVNISAPAEIETSFDLTISSAIVSPTLEIVDTGPNAAINSFSRPKNDASDPKDCTWNPRIHARSSGGRRYHCQRCRKKFLRKRDLNRHQHTVHGVLAYVCKIRGCMERFETMTELSNHRARVHLTTRTPRVCKLCSRKFVTEKSLMVHLRWHNHRPFRCKKCESHFQTRKEWYQHQGSSHPMDNDQPPSPKSPIKNIGGLSKKEEVYIQAVLSKLPAILPKPPRGSHPKLPIPPYHNSESSPSGRELRPLMPASFVNSFPEENYVPIYTTRPSSAIENASEQTGHPPINAILPPQYSQANYENTYPMDSSYYVQSYQNLEVNDQAGSVYNVQLETDFGIPPVEVVDLNTYPVEVTNLPDFNWSNPDSYAVDHNQNWLQPITLYGESQEDAELMQMVEETLQGDMAQNL